MSAVQWSALGFETEYYPAIRTLCRSARTVPARIKVRNVAEVQKAIALASKAGVKLAAVSGGKNWGYGSALPPGDDTSVVDLSGLKQISELDPDTRSVRVEAGVTQRELYAFVEKNAPELRINVTGAGLDTSIIGNGLERGIGYGGERDKELFAYEVVLADGSLHGPERQRQHKARNTAAGHDVDALWPQSNFAVVVAARVRLRVRQECEDTILLRGAFNDVLEACKICYRAQVVTLPFHIGEPGRMGRIGAGLLAELWGREPTAGEVARVFPEQSAHVALGALHGRARVVSAAWREIRRLCPKTVTVTRGSLPRLDRLERLARIVGFRDAADRLKSLRPLLALTAGVPSDIGLMCLEGQGRKDPDAAGEGALYLNAVSAVNAADAHWVEEIVRARWHDVALTRITLSDHCLITVVTLHFPDANAAAAHTAAKEILGLLASAGFPPYRIGINDSIAASPISKRIKEALDPTAMFAPGRYGL